MVNFIVMKKAELGKFLARRRKSLRITQRELAEICGISEHALCILERGEGNSTISVIEAVAEKLGLEMQLVPKQVELS